MELVLTFLEDRLGGDGVNFPKIMQEGSQAHTVATLLSQEQNSFSEAKTTLCASAPNFLLVLTLFQTRPTSLTFA